MKNTISRAITWDYFDDKLKTALLFDLEKAQLSKATNVLKLDIKLNFIIPFGDLVNIEKEIKKELPQISGISFNFIYNNLVISEAQIIEAFIKYMISEAEKLAPQSAKVIFCDEYFHDSSKSSLCLKALGTQAVKDLNSKVSKSLEILLEKNFDIKIKVIFENNLEYLETKNKETIINECEEEKNISNSNNKKEIKFAETTKDIRNGIIFGKRITDEPIDIETLKDQKYPVTIQGKVFSKTSRSIRNNKMIISLLINDITSSICIKLFISQEKAKDILEYISEGDSIKVRGNLEFDNFENSLVLMGKDIEEVKIQKRMDQSIIKRVELHAHTKMSAMDGLCDVGELIKTAESWGHKAIAITDHGVLQAFPDAMYTSKGLKNSIKVIYGVEAYLVNDDYKSKESYHCIILVKNYSGLKNLYKLTSMAHLQYFYKKPRIPKSFLTEHREGLLIGSACEAGEVFQGFLNKKSDNDIEKIIDFYDYLEIQPLINNEFLIANERLKDQDELISINIGIVNKAKTLGKLIVGTCDVHYIEQEDSIYRKILMAGQGYKDIEGDKGLYLRTTEEMLKEFSYFDKDTAEEIVITNTNKIADLIEDIIPVPDGVFAPKIEGSEEILSELCNRTAREKYGDKLPEIVEKRLNRELNAIITHGYAVMYVVSEMLVKKSMEDGYLVGSRGSVGSSFAATMSGITEVNPLPPHYLCPECKYADFTNENKCGCGIDMEDKICPVCSTKLDKDGFDIPFEVFLGFDCDKEPDIDLNFASEYQSVAHKYTETIFGKDHVFRAGTIGTIASKTAYGFVMKYFEERGETTTKWEVERLTKNCTGVRRTTGQHPGGVMIVPQGKDIYDFCPIQYPANDQDSSVITTHFDYHSISGRLLKLDILGHDVPTMIKMLQDLTGVDPLKVPLKDEKVDSIFTTTMGLNLTIKNYRYKNGTFGIPEFGTKFVRQMLEVTKPTTFSDLTRISGLSHGTNVWINNAQELISNNTAQLKDVISTRDDIMNYLIAKGVENKIAFRIMENVRKGKGVSEDDIEIIKAKGVPDWYVESCNRIEYMFPKAHAVAYVMMSYRIAYYKVYYPLEFYAATFTLKVNDFDCDTILGGIKAVEKKIASIEDMEKSSSKKNEAELTVLELAYEMYARGFEFTKPDISISEASSFKVVDGKLLVPLQAISGVGENAAKAILMANKMGPFYSIDDLVRRTKINKTAVESLKNQGVLSKIPETDQITLF